MNILSAVKKRANVYFVVAAILTVVGITLWRLCTTDYADDLVYRHVCEPATDSEPFWNAEGRLVQTFSDAVESSIYHYKVNNCRLANIVCIFMMLLPRWLVNCIDALVGIMLFFMIFKVARVNCNKIHPLTTILGTLLYWTVLRWYNSMNSTDFFINYAWSSVVMLVAMWAFNRGAQLTRWQAVIACILGFMATWMHEAFGCSLIAYSFFFWLLGDKRDKKVRFAIGVCMCLALIVVMGKSTGARVGLYFNPESFKYLHYRFTLYASQLWPSFVAIAMTVWLRRTVGREEFSHYRLQTIGNFAAIAVNVMISIIVSSMDRGLWPADLFAILQSIMCFEVIAQRRFKSARRFGAIFACLAVLYAVWLAELVKWQWKFRDENNALFEACENTDKPLIYYDLTQPEDAPFYLMGMPNHDWYKFYSHFLAEHTMQQPGIVILPTRYKGVPLEDIHLPGSERIKGVWPMFYAINDTSVHNFDIVVGEPTRAASPIDRLLMKFTPKEGRFLFHLDDDFDVDIDGKHYYFYYASSHGRTVSNRQFLRIENEQSWEEFIKK